MSADISTWHISKPSKWAAAYCAGCKCASTAEVPHMQMAILQPTRPNTFKLLHLICPNCKKRICSKCVTYFAGCKSVGVVYKEKYHTCRYRYCRRRHLTGLNCKMYFYKLQNVFIQSVPHILLAANLWRRSATHADIDTAAVATWHVWSQQIRAAVDQRSLPEMEAFKVFPMDQLSWQLLVATLDKISSLPLPKEP